MDRVQDVDYQYTTSLTPPSAPVKMLSELKQTSFACRIPLGCLSGNFLGASRGGNIHESPPRV